MSEFKGTPGPWRWELNKKSKDLNLCGQGEYGPYDFTVMDFERWGIGGAVPRFRTGDLNLMVKAYEFAKVVEGREHHQQWFQTIDHPDAVLISSAPDLLKALENICQWLRNYNSIPEVKIAQEFENMETLVRATIDKAVGRGKSC